MKTKLLKSNFILVFKLKELKNHCSFQRASEIMFLLGTFLLPTMPYISLLTLSDSLMGHNMITWDFGTLSYWDMCNDPGLVTQFKL